MKPNEQIMTTIPGAVRINGLCPRTLTGYDFDLHRDGGAKLRVRFVVPESGPEIKPELEVSDIGVLHGGRVYYLRDIALVSRGGGGEAGGVARIWYEYVALNWIDGGAYEVRADGDSITIMR